MSKISDFINYGKQIGSIHKDGTILRKANVLSLKAKSGDRTLLKSNGRIKEFITKNRRPDDTIEITRVIPKENSTFEITKTLCIKNKYSKAIVEDKFIGTLNKNLTKFLGKYLPIDNYQSEITNLKKS